MVMENGKFKSSRMHWQAGDPGSADAAVQVQRMSAVEGETFVLFRPSND